MIRAFLTGVGIGLVVGWLRSRQPEDGPVTQEWWETTFPATANTPAWTYTTKHPLQSDWAWLRPESYTTQ